MHSKNYYTKIKKSHIITHLVLFLIFNFALYFFISRFHSVIPFSYYSYSRYAHHFIQDPRISNQPFNLFSALAQYDAQWYLKIAVNGYSYSATENPSLFDKTSLGNITFNFFPLFPVLIKIMLAIVPHPESAAFILTNLLLLASFLSLLLVAGAKTAWLEFVFPYSIFFRSYHTESLILILSLWCLHFLHRKRNFFLAAIFLSLLNITKGRALPLDLIFLVLLIKNFYSRRLTLKQTLSYLTITFLPTSAWILFNYQATGHPFYFLNTTSLWQATPLWLNPLNVVYKIFHFNQYPLLFSIPNQIELLFIVIFALLISLSRKHLPLVLWGYSLLTFLMPLLVFGPYYFVRTQIVNFPIFIYLSNHTSKPVYITLLLLSTLSLFFISLYFVNWYWLD